AHVTYTINGKQEAVAFTDDGTKQTYTMPDGSKITSSDGGATWHRYGPPPGHTDFGPLKDGTHLSFGQDGLLKINMPGDSTPIPLIDNQGRWGFQRADGSFESHWSDGSWALLTSDLQHPREVHLVNGTTVKQEDVNGTWKVTE